MKKFPIELLRILGLNEKEGITPMALDESTLEICFDEEIDEKTAAHFQKVLNGTYAVEVADPQCLHLEKKREWRWDWEV